MRTLSKRSPSIPTLYVKSAPYTYYIGEVFSFARRMSPCLLVLEDIETIVTPDNRSYFFNEVDGLANNDGILMVASTNYVERLDPGLTKRPSRFDRKYLFPLPDEQERELYAEFWRNKLEKNANVEFPKKLCKPIATITYDFSFAYIQEAFVATLLEIARRRTDNLVDIVEELRLADDRSDDLDQYVLWRVFKKQVKILREDMDSQDPDPGQEYRYTPPSMRDSQLSLPPPAPTPPSALRFGGQSQHQPLRYSRTDSSGHAFGSLNSPLGRNKDADQIERAREFLSQFDKVPMINRGVTEYRPYDGEVSWGR
jgi:transitional endoplasmic reticulum ATPase